MTLCPRARAGPPAEREASILRSPRHHKGKFSLLYAFIQEAAKQGKMRFRYYYTYSTATVDPRFSDDKVLDQIDYLL